MMSDDGGESHCFFCFCCRCCPACLGRCLDDQKESRKKYAQISYKPVPQTQPESHRSLIYGQGYAQNHPGVVLPEDMKILLERSVLQRGGSSPYIVRKQPRRRGEGAAVQQGPSTGEQPTTPSASGTKRDSSSSLSEGSPPPTLTRLRSVLLTPKQGEEDTTIDISQSPTGTFSSAYRRSQNRRSYPSVAQSTPSPHHSAAREESSDETEEAQASSHRRRHSEMTEESSTSEVEQSMTMQVSMYYHVESERLSVCLHGAQNLPPRTNRHYTIFVHLVPEMTDTREMRFAGEDCNPTLNLSFEIQNVARDKIRQSKLVVRLYDGSVAGEPLGSAVVELDQADLFGMMFTVTLTQEHSESRGELLVSLSYNNKTAVLDGILLKLTNTSEGSGIPDIYVKIYLVYKGKRSRYWKSSAKKSGFSLIFNEAFQFDIRHKDLRHISLEAYVMGHDRLSKDGTVGRVAIGERVGEEAGRQHWTQILSQPLARISHWHSFSAATESSKKSSP